MEWPSVLRRFVQAGNTMYLSFQRQTHTHVQDKHFVWSLQALAVLEISEGAEVSSLSSQEALIEMQTKSCSFSSALYNWLTVLGDACPVPTSIQYRYHRGSLVTRCIVIRVCRFPGFTTKYHIGSGLTDSSDGCHLCFWEHSSYQISPINSQVWLQKWKLNILPTRKTNLKIHF